MCTVSWTRNAGGYDLLVNRDEKRSRGTAFAPQVMERGGVRYIAPIDRDFGGTWLSVNEFGVSLCLLNGSSDVESRAPRRSRGLLLRDLVWAPEAGEALVWLKQMDLSAFAPFSLVILESARPAIVAQWDGEDLTIDPAGEKHMPLTSSSYDDAGVRRSRLNTLAGLVNPSQPIDSSVLYRFHSSHGSSADAYSPCMHRSDAQTVSFSWITVSQGEVRFLYMPDAPCRRCAAEQPTLRRAA